MNAKLKILCTGTASYVELDGKTIGRALITSGLSTMPEIKENPAA